VETKKLREEIHALTKVIWISEKMPEHWKTAVTCHTHTHTQREINCNYRRISPLNACYKVLTNIQNRLLVECGAGNFRLCGFRKER